MHLLCTVVALSRKKKQEKNGKNSSTTVFPNSTAWEWIIIIIILSRLTSLDSSKPIQKRISANHEDLSTPNTT